MVAAKIADWETGTNQHTRGGANLPADSAADMLNVSERTVKSARSVCQDELETQQTSDGNPKFHCGIEKIDNLRTLGTDFPKSF